jgi:hypothetical protein
MLKSQQKLCGILVTISAELPSLSDSSFLGGEGGGGHILNVHPFMNILYIAECGKCLYVSKIKNFSFQLEEVTTTNYKIPPTPHHVRYSSAIPTHTVYLGKEDLADNCRGIHLLAAKNGLSSLYL